MRYSQHCWPVPHHSHRYIGQCYGTVRIRPLIGGRKNWIRVWHVWRCSNMTPFRLNPTCPMRVLPVPNRTNLCHTLVFIPGFSLMESSLPLTSLISNKFRSGDHDSHEINLVLFLLNHFGVDCMLSLAVDFKQSIMPWFHKRLWSTKGQQRHSYSTILGVFVAEKLKLRIDWPRYAFVDIGWLLFKKLHMFPFVMVRRKKLFSSKNGCT